MKKKKQKSPRPKKGRALFDDVVRLTGLPTKSIRQELRALFERKNIDVKNLTLEQLRAAAASYLREIMAGRAESDNRSQTRH